MYYASPFCLSQSFIPGQKATVGYYSPLQSLVGSFISAAPSVCSLLWCVKMASCGWCGENNLKKQKTMLHLLVTCFSSKHMICLEVSKALKSLTGCPWARQSTPCCDCFADLSTKQGPHSESGREEWLLHSCGKVHLQLLKGHWKKKEVMYYLWWGHGGVSEQVRGCCSPGCSTCSSAWAKSSSFHRADFAPCWDNIGKTSAAKLHWAYRARGACPPDVLQK